MSYNTQSRIVDLVLITILSPLILPILVALVVMNFVLSPDGVFFNQKRLGLNGSTFIIFKFKTMRDGNEEDCDRLTPFGRLLRRTSLDELPQLYNVLIGDMSLVGPRPVPGSAEQADHDFKIAARSCVRPGLTGFAQVRYLGHKRSFSEKLELDLYFVKHATLWLYIKVLVMTPYVLVVRFTSTNGESL